jgi:uncharacterized protein YeeX (DUF496 family)
MSFPNQLSPQVSELLQRREQLLRKIAWTDEKILDTQERLEWLKCLLEENEPPKTK